jgi:hypothetical protein
MTTDASEPARPDRTPFARPLAAYWFVQAVAVPFVVAVWIGLAPDDSSWYSLENLSRVGRVFAEVEFWVVCAILVSAVTLAQILFLLPVRKPGITTGHGRSLRRSLAVAGLAAGLGVLAVLLTLWGMVDRELEGLSAALGPMSGLGRLVVLLGVLAVAWTIPTLLIARFARPGPRETVLARWARRLLMGTAAEALLVIPLDAMIRRRTDCYCAEGSFWGLSILAIVGFVAAGPAVLLPLLSARRQGWYRAHCNACGYDMRGSTLPRCLECGTAWPLVRSANAAS